MIFGASFLKFDEEYDFRLKTMPSSIKNLFLWTFAKIDDIKYDFFYLLRGLRFQSQKIETTYPKIDFLMIWSPIFL